MARMGPSTSLIYITQADRPPSACIRLQAKARIQTDLHDGNKVNIQKQNQRYTHTIHYYERARCVHGAEAGTKEIRNVWEHKCKERLCRRVCSSDAGNWLPNGYVFWQFYGTQVQVFGNKSHTIEVDF